MKVSIKGESITISKEELGAVKNFLKTYNKYFNEFDELHCIACGRMICSQYCPFLTTMKLIEEIENRNNTTPQES
jgi:ferredoxin